MQSEWRERKLGEILKFANGRTSPERADDGAFVVYGANGPIGLSSEHNSPSDTIVIGRVGSYCGAVHFSHKPCWVTDNAIRAEVLPGNHPYYIFSLLRMLDLNRWRSGSGQPLLNQSILSAIQVNLPSFDVQYGIGMLLKQFDDRIELLRQTNLTLESIAQALFKSWFIDFDPVHAKAEGREPEGIDAETAALFPDTFDESVLGEIPKGWTGIPFGELLSFAIGGDWGAEGPTDTCTQPATIIRGTDIPDIAAGQFDDVPRRYVSPKKSEKRKLQDGDLVIEVSGGSKTQPTGRSLYVTKDVLKKLGETAVPTSFCRLFRAPDAHTALLLSQHLTAIYQAGKMWNYQVQSTGLANFQTQHFLDSEMVVVPPPSVRKAFFDIVRPLVDRICSAPIAELAALRDTLLPRLISGKLRLPEAEAQLNEALA
ncbi:restriction endonuclease subunit S [Paraburkholderia sp. CNPSo 3272]|uniref:restriction endonuclease subunit S n=1 Tax=Paraburkholderia sp. CNPSo 3272 TaxID=2940931 RepID=UPI0020B7F872|nr:restriction endonuclease subunit S [Paraburkholderia sp. CNPSo 3272]MCP3722589.1 restriction endonuclease subunit S [Paraburkholderia sp. CNPSo 3272]